MKIFKEIKEQYDYLWWWLLEQGTLVSMLIVNSFFFMLFAVSLGILYVFLKWYAKHLH
jgi:hypothetical protein